MIPMIILMSFDNRTIETSPGMADFDRACVYIDNVFKSDSFTVSNKTVAIYHKMTSFSFSLTFGENTL